jgi:hypothetical protein
MRIFPPKEAPAPNRRPRFQFVASFQFLYHTTVSSNFTGWYSQLRLEGKITSGSVVDTTNVLDIPYPQSRQVAFPGIGTVTGWFLSDGELLAFDKRMTE